MKILLLLLSGAKLGKAAVTGGTMLLSIGAYALLFGWPYAAGFVLLIFCHEMGHFLAAKQRGLDVGAPTFIPFVGAWIQLKKQPMDVETEAYVGIAGPVLGTIAAVACYYAGEILHSRLLLALAYAGLMLNLFNLIPISPLDGGRIAAIISPKLWWGGLPILLGLFVINQSPMLLLIAVLAIPHLLSSFKQDGENGKPPQYYDVSTSLRWNYAIYYIGLTAFLAVMSYQLHQMI
ncbi:MAG: site-2 protease family protein [Nitrospira sp.]|nr:site-2 protease family protein [Nitrospira sp.]